MNCNFSTDMYQTLVSAVLPENALYHILISLGRCSDVLEETLGGHNAVGQAVG